jgi:hypothetical protein
MENAAQRIASLIAVQTALGLGKTLARCPPGGSSPRSASTRRTGILSIGSARRSSLGHAQPPRRQEFTIVTKNAGAKNIYIQSATLNGKPLTTPRISHDAIVRGGTLTFTMGPQPNRALFSSVVNAAKP